MDLEQNPFAFLGEEEDTDVLIQNAKASAAAAARAAKEAALEENQKDKNNERNTLHFSTRAKRITLPRYVTRRDIIVRKEKPEGEGEEGYRGNFQHNSADEAHKSNGDNKGIINRHNSCNGHANNNFMGSSNSRVEGSLSNNKNNVNANNGHSPASNNGHHRGGSSGFSKGVYQGKYRRGFYNNGGRSQYQGFNGNNSNVSNQKLEKKVGQVSYGVEKIVEEDGWTKVEKKRSKGRRGGSYESSQVSTVSEKDTTLEDVQEVIINVENNASEKDTTSEDVQEVDNVSEKEIVGEVQQDINAENNVAEAVNGENKSNETEGEQKSSDTGEKPRTKKNGSQMRKNKNKNIEVAQNVSKKKEEQVTNHSQKMTLKEYEKSLLEKRKALESLKKTENSRVIQMKDFESMVHVRKKSDDGVSTNQNTKESHSYKKDGHKEDEKGHKVVSMVELRKKCGLTFNHRPQNPYGGRRGGYHVGESDKKEPVKGNGAAPETQKQQPAKGSHAQKTEANKLSGFERRNHHKNVDAPLEGEAEKTHPLPPTFENLIQFPNLGGRAA